jgi:hypothetical protein
LIACPCFGNLRLIWDKYSQPIENDLCLSLPPPPHSCWVNKSELLLTAIAILLLGWWWVPRSTSRSSDSKPLPVRNILEIDAADLSFGEVFETSQCRLTLAVRNTSGEPVTVSRFDMGCDCATPIPQAATIPAGGRLPLEVSIDLSRRNGMATSGPRFVEYRLTAVLNDATVHRWTIRGQVKPLISAELPDTAAVPLFRDGPAPVWTVRVNPTVPISRMTLAGASHLTHVQLTARAPGYQLLARPTTNEVGRLTASVDIDLINDAGQALPRQSIVLPLQVTERVRPVPERLDLGPVQVGSTREKIIVLHPRHEYAPKLISVESEPKTMSAVRHDMGDMNGEVWMVQTSPAGPGHSAGVIRWRFKDALGEYQVEVPVSWYGAMSR